MRRRLCLKIGDNEVSTNDNFSLDYAWVICVQSRTLILGYIVQVGIEIELHGWVSAYFSLHEFSSSYTSCRP